MRFSRGRSTPTRRAILCGSPDHCGGLKQHRSREAVTVLCSRVPSLLPGVTSCAGTAGAARPTGAGCCFSCSLSRAVKKHAARAGRSALTLLVSQVLADHHDPAMTADHFALVADLLDAGMNLHLPAVLIGLLLSDPRVRAVREEPVGVVTPVRRGVLVSTAGDRAQTFNDNGRQCGRGSGHTD